jgi:hypothetical protein
MKATFQGFTEVDKPASFKFPLQTKMIGGVECVLFYKYVDIKNPDDFIAGEDYDVEIIEGYAMAQQ